MRRLGPLALIFAGCGTPATMPGQDLAMMIGADLAGTAAADMSMGGPPGDLACSADLAMATYPAGPYGNTVGATFPLLAWEGYVNDAADSLANTKPYGAYSTEALRRSGRRYALIHVSEFN